jgi:hypothetical protein
MNDSSRTTLDPGIPIQCIGRGALGGKAQGLVNIRAALHSKQDLAKFADIKIDIPEMSVLGTDVFCNFMERNRLYEVALSGQADERIAHAFQKADLPFEILGSLRAIMDQAHTPLAVRSSSLLEDAEHEPFAGIYETKMIPNSLYDPDTRFRQLVEAIKFVYASTFFKAARDYRQAIGHRAEDEAMAVIIQEVIGKRYQNRFYPELSGAARSYNYYPMAPARAEDGVVSLALGLGKTIVDGGTAWTYSPAYPRVGPPYGSVKELLGRTQTTFWAVNMDAPPAYDPTGETEYLVCENLEAAEKDGALDLLASTYNPQDDRLAIGTGTKGARALTFAPLLVLNEAPINDLAADLLSICAEAMGGPVEIEFAATFNPHRFGFLQVRKMAVSFEQVEVPEEELNRSGLLAATRSALGNGVLDDIQDVVYMRPQNFELKHTLKIAPQLKQLNKKLLDQKRPYLLIALGRLGTTDHWLGVPVQWGDVCGARAVIEVAQEKARVELSQGSHYFHNILNLGVKYFLLPFYTPYKIDWDWLDQQEAVEETAYVRHVRLASPLLIKVDGRTSRGIIAKAMEDKDGRA